MPRSREWALCALLLVGPIARAQSPDLRGIYVDSNAFPISKAATTALAASLNVLGVDGLVLVLGWDGIEPAMGQYQWDTLDQWMGMAVGAGRKVELSIRADLAPAWLFQPSPGGAGANPLSFSYAPQGGAKDCNSETIAAPWDSAFLTQWDAMLTAVAGHLKSAGTYSAVSLLRLTGINRNSDELHLPAQTPQSANSACVSDSVTTWLQAGYRPSRLLQGWDATTSSFKKSFPDKYFSVAIIDSSNPFPPIAEDGSVIPLTSPQSLSPSQNAPLLTLASQKFSGRLIIQNNSLYPGQPAEPKTIQFGQSLGTLTAFQTNEVLGGTGGAACGAPQESTPCTDATFLQELETGIYPLDKSNTLRSQYIEVFPANVNALPGATLQAHYELIPFNSKNSASYSTAPLAPDMIAFGEAASVAGGPLVAPDGPWPPMLGGARLDITDSVNQTRPSPLYFVTTNQLGYLIPAATALGHASLTLTTSAGATVSDGFQVQRISPGLFTANASGSGVPAGFWIRVAANGAQTQDYLYDPSQAIGSRTPVPVDLGTSTDQVFLSLYGTGFRGASQAAATVGGLPVNAVFTAVSAYQGEDLVNIGPLPRSLAGQGVVSVVVNFDGQSANSVAVSIK